LAQKDGVFVHDTDEKSLEIPLNYHPKKCTMYKAMAVSPLYEK